MEQEGSQDEEDVEEEDSMTSVSSLGGGALFHNKAASGDDENVRENRPRYLMPTFASTLPEYTHLEVLYMRHETWH
jgi:hypothetical protein